jgi:putative membrane protein
MDLLWFLGAFLSGAIHQMDLSRLVGSKWMQWQFQPGILLGIGITGGVYLLGVFRVWRSAGFGHGIRLRRVFAFLGAIGALILALISPVDSLSEALFSAHMLQHMLLILVAAPLFVISEAPVAFLWFIPRSSARSIGVWWQHSRRLRPAWQQVNRIGASWAIFTITLWAWHLPAIYQAALENEILHAIEHILFLLSAALFWWTLLPRSNTHSRRHDGIAILSLFASMLQMSVLSGLMIFSNQAWYSGYAGRAALIGLDPLQDQQLGGLIMWLPGGVLFAILIAVFFASWKSSLEKQMQRGDQSG